MFSLVFQSVVHSCSLLFSKAAVSLTWPAANGPVLRYSFPVFCFAIPRASYFPSRRQTSSLLFAQQIIYLLRSSRRGPLFLPPMAYRCFCARFIFISTVASPFESSVQTEAPHFPKSHCGTNGSPRQMLSLLRLPHFNLNIVLKLA